MRYIISKFGRSGNYNNKYYTSLDKAKQQAKEFVKENDIGFIVSSVFKLEKCIVCNNNFNPEKPLCIVYENSIEEYKCPEEDDFEICINCQVQSTLKITEKRNISKEDILINFKYIINNDGLTLEIYQGWYNLIYECFFYINKMLMLKKKKIHVDQIKTKFGGLRFYVTPYDKKIEKVISYHEKKSLKCCEFCGKKGKPGTYGGHWILTLCPECVEKKQNQKANK